MNTPIRIEPRHELKAKPNQEALGFGNYFTDHMFMMDYAAELGWHDPRIVPYAPLSLDPAASVLHYGQAIFEGLKAFKTPDQRILLFRPDKNAKRLNTSGERLQIPPVDEALFIHALKSLIRLEADWIPDMAGASLYIRPFVIATEATLGVRASSRYLFVIILSPVGAYYDEGMQPIRILVEKRDVRSVRGGTGFAKTAGNYAGSLRAQAKAKERGCAQVLWLDAFERTYIEEVGSMNVFFKINGDIYTPALTGTILEGVTRSSVIELLKSWGLSVYEQPLSLQDLIEAANNGTLEEAFGTGTAAVISPIGELHGDGLEIVIHGGEVGPLSQKLYDTLTGIQYGRLEDPFGWTVDCSR